MSTPSHHRFKITNKGQHPYNHDGSEIGYASEAFPDIISVSGALDYVAGVLYPNLKPAVANVAALPALGNAVNDYRLVMDDGDGKSAGYRWAKYEDEVSPSWHKIYDIDWGLGDVLSATEAATQANYVYKWGRNDKDASGVDIAGLYAGSRIYGGSSANTNLTLNANIADPNGGAGNQTGYVQVDSQFRPAYHDSYDAGTSTERWRTVYAQTSIVSGDLTIASGLITDSSGAISFADENLTTTGFLRAGNLKLAANSLTSENANGNIILNPNGIGTIELQADTNVTGSLTATVNLDIAGSAEIGLVTISGGTIGTIAGVLTLDPDGANGVDIQGDLTGTGNLDFVGYGEFGNLRLTTNTISSQDANGNITLDPNGSGVINLSAATFVTGNLSVSSGNIIVGNLIISGNSITASNVNGDVSLDPNGAGAVLISKVFLPSTNNTLDLGSSGLRFNDLFLGGSIGDGTNAMTVTNLMTLRDINVGVAAGMSLFYDGSKWVASVPDTEITHSTLSGLTTGDAGHTQFALLAGRAGGQTLNGGTAASENLTLDSTAHATKGVIYIGSDIHPSADASYSGGWSGTDLGDSTKYLRHIYSKGEHFNLRLENVGALPGASAQNVGRIVFNTATNSVSVDQGGAWVSFVSAAAFLNGLNTFGANATLGLTDAFTLGIYTNNALAISIATDQKTTFTGNILATDGSAGFPGFAFSADTNTGIYRAGSDSMSFATGGVSRWNINSSGNWVGQSSTTNDILLGTNANGAMLRLAANTSVDSTNGAYITLASVGDNTNAAYGDVVIASGNSSEGQIIFRTAGSERVQISSPGQLLISDGSAGSPGISFIADTNTGIFRAGSDSMSFATGGSPAINFNSSQQTFIYNLLDLSNSTAGQIQFPATQNASAGANTLDDYEEGAVTLSLSFSGGNGTAAFTTQALIYTKVGRIVYIQGFIDIAKGTAAGNLSLTGLPFTSIGTASVYGTLLVYSNGGFTLPAGDTEISGFIGVNGTTLILYFNDILNGTTQVSAAAMSASASCFISGWYTASA